MSGAEDEALQKKFRKLQETPGGRAILRQRVAVEHALAHIAARKGNRARYLGTRKNLFDPRRAAAISSYDEREERALRSQRRRALTASHGAAARTRGLPPAPRDRSNADGLDGRNEPSVPSRERGPEAGPRRVT